MLDPDKQLLEVKAASGLAPERPSMGIPLGQMVAGRVALERSTLYIQRREEAPPDARLNPATQSLLVVPLLSRGRVLGTLSLDGATPRAFSEDDQRLLTTVAAQISTAIENAQLYKDL